MTRRQAYAKINLGLVVGPLRADGKHEVVTLMQEVDLHDDVAVEPAAETSVHGYANDTIVAFALTELAQAAVVKGGWRVDIEKRIPVAAGLGGGSSDAASALACANAMLDQPLADTGLRALAARVGADVPFFLVGGTCLATGDGTELRRLPLALEYTVVLFVPDGVAKDSTRAVYDAFDRRSGEKGYAERASTFTRVAESIDAADDLVRLPGNDLVSSPVTDDLLALGAFRADVSGAGPTVYGLFLDAGDARRAEEALRPRGRTFVTHPV